MIHRAQMLKILLDFGAFSALESCNMSSKNGKLKIDFEDSEVYWGEN